jgi:micrococcal nuclease
MARKGIAVLVVGVVGFVAAAGVPTPGSAGPVAKESTAWFTLRGKVTRVVDGDTLHVRVGAKTEKVRLIGIDAPEQGACYAVQASAALRTLAFSKRVKLTGDRTQSRRDRYNRLLAYVTLPNGTDAGKYLLLRGYAVVYETTPPFARYPAYSNAAADASEAGAGLYPTCHGGEQPPPVTTSTTTTGTTPVLPVAPLPPPPPSGNCAPSYPDVCIPPPPPDLDCGQISHRSFRVIYTVASPDPHRFDGDRDGVGCES